MDAFAREMTANLFGNPHSASASSQLSTTCIEDTRLRVLQWFNADPDDFDVVFVANATAGIKLVAEALRSAPAGFDYMYHQACHTSLVGVREEARNSHCFVDPEFEGPPVWGRSPDRTPGDGVTLVAYPAQSNMDGQRFPLTWSAQFRQQWAPTGNRVYTLLDAAALVATSPLDLGNSETAPDFTVLSFYKIFGFPDLGALIVRRQAEPVFDARKYFGGGTVDMVVCQREQWHAPKRQFLHERLEDGTLPIHSIVALGLAMGVYFRLFGSIRRVAQHASYLADRLYEGLRSLKHSNGASACSIYSGDRSAHNHTLGFGPVVAFNIRSSLGAWVPLVEFEKLATLKGFHVRTGGVCNPGGVASALGLEPWEMKNNFSSGFRCGSENDIIGAKPTGVIRASLGAMSTASDVDRFVAFVDEFYREPNAPATFVQKATPPRTFSDLYVRSITVYPIKSCGGYQVPDDREWEVRPEGLAWDREWCLLHRGTGQALSQKRHPKMVLLRPTLDFDGGQLRVTFGGDIPSHLPKYISVPLSKNPAMFGPAVFDRLVSSRVCGEEISAQTYTSPEVNRFFSDVLGVPCVLARFPPGGQGRSMRHSKARLQKHQMLGPAARTPLPGSFPGPPSPPESESDTEKAAQRRILLSNESPILLVNTCSLAALNRDVAAAGGAEVSAAVFRANVVVGPAAAPHGQQQQQQQQSPYAEDGWARLRIGGHEFRMLGSCRRCHMICVDQGTGERREEPFVTLSKTRRFDGKVFFGAHMGHSPGPCPDTARREVQFPTIRVGDFVKPDVA